MINLKTPANTESDPDTNYDISLLVKEAVDIAHQLAKPLTSEMSTNELVTEASGKVFEILCSKGDRYGKKTRELFRDLEGYLDGLGKEYLGVILARAQLEYELYLANTK